MIKEEVLKERKSSDIFSLQLVLFLKTLTKTFKGTCKANVKGEMSLASNFFMLGWSTQMLKIAPDPQHTIYIWKQALIWGQPGFAFSSRHIMWVWHPEYATRRTRQAEWKQNNKITIAWFYLSRNRWNNILLCIAHNWMLLSLGTILLWYYYSA